MNTPAHARRGFALIVVVLIVALLALVAVTLLDLVKVDLTLTGGTRKTLEARAVADGALLEIFDDARTVYPDGAGPGRWIAANPRNLLADPRGALGDPATAGDGRCGLEDAPCIDSAFYRGATPDSPAQDYAADVCLLGLGPLRDSSLEHTRAAWYQLRAIGEVGSGESLAEVRMEVVRPVRGQNGVFAPIYHCR